MPENVIEQISSELRRTAAELYPNHGELKNVRLVGHTPKPEHYIYDVVIDFAEFVVPRGEAIQLSGDFTTSVVKVLAWANDPAILQSMPPDSRVVHPHRKPGHHLLELWHVLRRPNVSDPHAEKLHP